MRQCGDSGAAAAVPGANALPVGPGTRQHIRTLLQVRTPQLRCSPCRDAPAAGSDIALSLFRYYLGDRMLAQGNVWLETAVVDQIGSCFPSRFPQQILKNLSESAELQQEFHLYRLQQLDRCLQEQDQVRRRHQPIPVLHSPSLLF